MASNYLEWQLNLFDVRLNRPISDSTGLFLPLTAGTSTKATCYKDANGTSLTTPATMANGVIRFFTDSSVTSLDLIVVTASDHCKYMRAVTQSQQRVMIDTDQIKQIMYVPFTTAASAVVVDSGLKLSQTMLVKDAYARCYTVGSTTALLSAGTTTGSVTGFLNAIICTVTGWLALTEATTTTVTVNTRGSLLVANAAFTRQYHRPANATSGLSLIYQTDVTCTTPAQGFIVLEYDRLVAP